MQIIISTQVSKSFAKNVKADFKYLIKTRSPIDFLTCTTHTCFETIEISQFSLLTDGN